MKLRKIICLILILTSLNITLHLPIPSTIRAQRDALNALDDAGEAIANAFTAIHHAEASGLSGVHLNRLVDRLNEALNLLVEAGDGDVEEAEDKASNAILLSEGIVTTAEGWGTLAARQALLFKFFAFAYIPLVSLGLSLIIHYSYRWWRKRALKRLLRMEARVKHDG